MRRAQHNLNFQSKRTQRSNRQQNRSKEAIAVVSHKELRQLRGEHPGEHGGEGEAQQEHFQRDIELRAQSGGAEPQDPRLQGESGEVPASDVDRREQGQEVKLIMSI